MKRIRLSLITSFVILAVAGSAAVAMQTNAPAADSHLTSDPTVSVQKLGTIQPNSSPTVAPAATSPTEQSSGTDKTSVVTQQSETTPADTGTDQSAPAVPAAPTLVESHYYCMEMRSDGSLYTPPMQGDTWNPAASDVEVQMRLDTYSDSTNSAVNLGPIQGMCAASIVDY